MSNVHMYISFCRSQHEDQPASGCDGVLADRCTSRQPCGLELDSPARSNSADILSSETELLRRETYHIGSWGQMSGQLWHVRHPVRV